MWAVGLVAGAAWAGGLSVDDSTGCVDPAAVERALERVEGADSVDLAIHVLPEADRRSLQLVWAERHERELEVVSGDCDQVPDLVALATERVLADLPSRLRARRAPIVTSLGGAFGGGVDGWAPRGGVWVDWVTRSQVTPATGLSVAIGTQSLDEGAIWTTIAEGRLGAAARVGKARFDLGAVGGAILGRGTGLTQNRSTMLPRFSARTGVSSNGPARVGAFVEVPIVRPVWTVIGGGRIPEPLVHLQLEVGWALGRQ